MADPAMLATVASIVTGFGVAMLFFRIQRELQVHAKMEPQWIPWADRLLIGATLASILLVLLPVVVFPEPGLPRRIAAAVCAGSSILISGYVLGILAHYRLILGKERNQKNLPRANPEPAERAIVWVALVAAFVVTVGVLAYGLTRHSS